jgi:5-methylcytosine-specific restriction endonuclease McrA
MKKAHCRFCNASDGERIALLDGSTLHKACYNEIHRQLHAIEHYITSLDQKLSDSRRKLKPVEKLKRQFNRLFQNQSMDLQEDDFSSLKLKIQTLTQDRRIAAEKSGYFEALLSDVFDVWPTYPPDWSTRRASALAAGGGTCSRCGDRGPVDVHHLRPVREGGTHRLENLVLLCRECHRDVHGGRELGFARVGDDENKPTAAEKRIMKIRSAIDQGGSIHFTYTTRDGRVTKRTVRPHDIRKLSPEEIGRLTDNQSDREGSLCMFGYCHLRNDDRRFAVSRMRRVRVAP